MKKPDSGRPVTAEAAPGPESALCERLREGTEDLHRRAERAGVVADLLRGRAGRRAYALLLRNLLPVYRRLEAHLKDLEDRVPVPLASSALFRSHALVGDLTRLHGERFEQRLALLPAAARYADAVDRAARCDPRLLVAHAYTRYLGDLSGGQIIDRILRRSLELESDCLSFYRFPDIASPEEFKREYRGAIDVLGADPQIREPLVAEARSAFQHNIDVSLAVQAAVA